MCGEGGALSCQRAVQRAWRDLCRLGDDEVSGFRACTTLYLIRHPVVSPREARDLVAEWLDHAECDS
ncbi:MAG TPA: hypothetical protein VKQ27_07195 [Acetobacteraceae bacterium]|nr:hypothetical protein [Acetobacteraceae bacterium]